MGDSLTLSKMEKRKSGRRRCRKLKAIIQKQYDTSSSPAQQFAVASARCAALAAQYSFLATELALASAASASIGENGEKRQKTISRSDKGLLKKAKCMLSLSKYKALTNALP